jgi:hypothetical protein
VFVVIKKKKKMCLSVEIVVLNPSASRFPIVGPKPLTKKKQTETADAMLHRNGLQPLFGENRRRKLRRPSPPPAIHQSTIDL